MGKKSKKKDKKHRREEQEEAESNRDTEPEQLIGVSLPEGHVFQDITDTKEIERLKRRAAKRADSEAEDFDEALERKKQRQQALAKKRKEEQKAAIKKKQLEEELDGKLKAANKAAQDMGIASETDIKAKPKGKAKEPEQIFTTIRTDDQTKKAELAGTKEFKQTTFKAVLYQLYPHLKPTRVIPPSQLPQKRYQIMEAYNKKVQEQQAANPNWEGLSQSQLMFMQVNPVKCGIKKRIIKKLQQNRARKWESRWVLHPGAGEPGCLRPPANPEKTELNERNSQGSDESRKSALNACKQAGIRIANQRQEERFLRYSMDPLWMKKWVSKENVSAANTDIACGSVDSLTKREIELLKQLQFQESNDYAKSFYCNEFFESIHVTYQCEQCDKEFPDLFQLRKHVVVKHSLPDIGPKAAVQPMRGNQFGGYVTAAGPTRPISAITTQANTPLKPVQIF